MSVHAAPPLLPRLRPGELPARPDWSVPADIRRDAEALVADVASRGWPAVLEHGRRLGDLDADAPATYDPPALDAALGRIAPELRASLEAAADRIRTFADAQRRTLSELRVAVPGGEAGHDVRPLESAGCYAPGGRFPLPSSVLMTVVTARAAGVEHVWVASPRPTDVTLAAAAVAGADGLLAVGGAQAVAALAHGAGPVPACDMVCGPGNLWVVAAKQAVSGRVATDGEAGPSELAVVADGSADPQLVASDLLAQAEHDPDARPWLVSLDARVSDAVDRALAEQLDALPDARVARAALRQGASLRCADIEQARAICDRLAPEHLALHVVDADSWRGRLAHYGALFVGPGAAEALGDYGIGPNHVLPTAGAARQRGGLSVFDFLRVRTWLRVDDASAADEVLNDTRRLAEAEGLIAHARSAERRRARR